MSGDDFGDVRVATALAWRGANGYFPAYQQHVGEFINEDWLSCVDWHKKFHRDHISHQVMCYWIAKRLLDAKPPCGVTFGAKTLREWCIEQALYSPECKYLRDYAQGLGAYDPEKAITAECLWNAFFDEAVFLATMYHDIGYPWQFVQGITSQLAGSGPSPLLPMQMGGRELYDSYGARLLCYPFQNYSAPNSVQPAVWRTQTEQLLLAAQAKTHGLPGALAFLYLNDILRCYPEPNNSEAKGVFCIEWAAMAILMHDLQKLYAGRAEGGSPPENPQLRVSFRRDPLSFVLTLVDQIQDFCRPNAAFESTKTPVNLRYRHACHAVEVLLDENSPLHITYFYGDSADCAKNAVDFKPAAERDYFDSACGYVDWSGLPISSIKLHAEHETRSSSI